MSTDRREQLPDELHQMARHDAQNWNPADSTETELPVQHGVAVGAYEAIVDHCMTRNPETVSVHAVLDAQSLLRQFQRVRHLPVVQDGRLVGMLTRADVLRYAFSHPGQDVSVQRLMSTPAERVRSGDSLHTAAERMVAAHVHGLPVVDGGDQVLGIITDSDVMAAIASRKVRAPTGLDDVPVEAVMTAYALTVSPSATLREVGSMMLSKGVRHIPVVSDDDERLVGIISERDLRSRLGARPDDWFAMDRPELEEKVETVMIRDPIAVAAGTPLTEAMDVLIDEGIGAVPVVDDNEQIVGIFSYVDVLTFIRECVGPTVH